MANYSLNPTRKALADAGRSRGAQYITTVNGLSGAAPAAFTKTVVGEVDLSYPVRGFRFVVKGRVKVATADYSSVNPESLLNLISNIGIAGVGKRTGGNVSLDSGDLASYAGFLSLTQNFAVTVQVNGVVLSRPGVPYSNVAALTTASSPYDFIITIDIPRAPFGSSGEVENGFMLTADLWKNAVNFTLEFPTITDNAANPLGTSAATTVTTISAFGSATGSMTVDIYSLAGLLGSVQNAVVPGVIARSISPISDPLSTTKAGVKLLRLENEPTTRVYLKQGVASSFPVFTSLSDVIITAIGLQVGTTTSVRDKIDIQAARQQAVKDYGVSGIQGYFVYDFIPSGNPDQAYADPNVIDKGNVSFNLIGDVTGTANGGANIMQEQILAQAAGALVGS